MHSIETGDGLGPLWIKREDLSSDLYGGNKIRKLELLLAGSKRPVITFGAYGSHHVLATALHAHAVGRLCAALLVSSPPTAHHDEVQRLVERHLDLAVHAGRPAQQLRQAASALRRRLAGLDGKAGRGQGCPKIILPGATSPSGVLGYVGCGIELAEQIEQGACPRPDRIYAALGTGGTVAGLTLGLAFRGVDTTVVGVRVATRLSGNALSIKALMLSARALLKRHGIENTPRTTRFIIDERFIGEGYAVPTRAGTQAVRVAAERGVELETTYTGKALAAALADRREMPLAVQMLLDSYGPIGNVSSERKSSQL